MLDVADLHKRYGPAAALNGVSFRVEEGELFGLLGPNGAGKSTLLSILSCLATATSGAATLLGERLTPDNLTVRPFIGIVPQDLAIYPELTARENLAFFGALYGLSRHNLATRVLEVLDTIALADRADHRAGTFSGGMKRRLNLGCALMHRPRILYLDEPTVGVDPQSRNYIFEGVRRLNAAGTTVVYTSHYMEEVQALCSRAAILDHGKIIACDTLPKLLRVIGGQVRFKAPLTSDLQAQIGAIGQLMTQDDGWHVLRAADAATAVVQMLAMLGAARVSVTALEAQEPNLERVFLHLTGHALRD
ncbi:MAG: ABC transporter ATP-binding protein [Gemmataceae bacterium]